MLEVLISIVIVTMGLLGLAGMSMRSLAANDSSGYRATASLSALQIADLIRANRVAAKEGRYDLAFGSAAPSAGNTRTTSDVTAWLATLSTLPEGEGNIAYNSTDDLVTVSVRWDDTRGAQSHTEDATTLKPTYAYSFRP